MYLGKVSYLIITMYATYHCCKEIEKTSLTCGSNYLYLEQISMVQKTFEPFKVDCIFVLQLHCHFPLM